MGRICFLTPAEDYEEDWSALEADYRRLFGDALTFRCWTKPGDLAGFDIVSPLIAWGYQRDCERWFHLLDHIEREKLNCVNPATVLRWNSDKSYLFDLVGKGIAIVPTWQAAELCPDDLHAARAAFGTDMLVVKPPISGGADGTYRLSAKEPIPDALRGRRMLIQPFMPAIATEGEFSLFYFGGRFSHSIIKRPAAGDFRVQDKFGGFEEAIEAPDAARDLASAALAATTALTGCGIPAYARVDMLRDDAKQFRLVELELIEPSLFLHFAADGGAAFAQAIAALAKNGKRSKIFSSDEFIQ